MWGWLVLELNGAEQAGLKLLALHMENNCLLMVLQLQHIDLLYAFTVCFCKGLVFPAKAVACMLHAMLLKWCLVWFK
jgi:hypothetical protein